ncbi:energy transducer TonB [Algoriphagus aquatilis]|uniref:Energy transducer TonB n=1 Tax=Algoriphagus aquatilis TaxID=490186 RepID=A0ABW0BXR3_9BACT
MEHKKNPSKDLSKWKGALTHLGLAMSIGAVLVAFEWKAYEDTPLITITDQNSNWEEDFLPPITIITPPAPPVLPTQIKEIDNTIKLNPQEFPIIDIDLPGNDPIAPIELEEPPKETAPEIVDFTEVMASFKGGMEAWYTYLKDNLKYPRQEQKLGIEGTVILRFVINTDGSIQDVEIVRSASEGLDQAALNVIKNSPNWNPGKNGGRAVRSRMTIPIKFKLN